MQPSLEGQDFTSMFLTVSVVMVIICVAAFTLIKWVFPRLIRSPLHRKDGAIQILARYAIEPRQAIYVMRIGKKHVVLGASDKGLVYVTQLETDDLAAEWQ